MQQKSKDALVVWAGTALGGLGGWWGVTRLAATYSVPIGAWGVLAGGVIGAITGAVVTKTIVDDPGVIPFVETE